MNKRNIITLIFFLTINFTYSQELKDSSIFIPAISASYSFQIPGGDLAKRFGCNSAVGCSFTTKLKSNWVLGVEGNYMFGNDLKDEASGVLDGILTSNGKIISKHGRYATVLLSERGFYLGAKGGRLFVLNKSYPNSGILLSVSGGLLQYKIRIDNDGNDATQILGDKKKGYDKLTNGFAINEFIGYMHNSKNKLLNFYIGFELYQAWTQSRRDFDFDTMSKDTKHRKDYLYSIKVGWMVPFNKRMPDKFYIY